MFAKSITIHFAGITICFYFPTEIAIPKEFLPYMIDSEDKKTDADYIIILLDEPLQLGDDFVAQYNGIQIYRREDGWIRNYKALTTEDGCQVACHLKPNGKNILYYPANRWEYYAKEFRCLHLLGIEHILIRHSAFLLHSSVVQINGKTVLFSGPSGIGKSTQASLWEKYRGAEILNGDRCIIRKMNEQFYGCGSPWAGTSGIYSKKMEPIAGIVFLKQAEKNRIRPLKEGAFSKIYRQTIVNSWDKEFVHDLSLIMAQLLEKIPVYELECVPDENAVNLVYETLFEGK